VIEDGDWSRLDEQDNRWWSLLLGAVVRFLMVRLGGAALLDQSLALGL